MRRRTYFRCLSTAALTVYVLCVLILAYTQTQFERFSEATNVSMYEYWPVLRAHALAEVAVSLSSILLVGLWTLRMVPSNLVGKLSRGVFLFILGILGGMILLVDVIMSLSGASHPVWYMSTYALGQGLWYTYLGIPETIPSRVVYYAVWGIFPLLTLNVLGLVVFLPYILSRWRRKPYLPQAEEIKEKDSTGNLHLQVLGFVTLLLALVLAAAAINYFGYFRSKEVGLTSENLGQISGDERVKFMAQTTPISYLPVGPLRDSEEVAKLQQPPDPPTLRGSAISLADDHLAVLTPTTAAESSEGFKAIFHLIPLSGEGENVTVPVLFPRIWRDESARKLNIGPFNSGPIFSRGRWYVCFTPYSYQAASAAGEDCAYGSAIYSFPPEGGMATEWFPSCAPKGVIGFTIHDDAMYLVPALGFAESVKCLKSRSMPVSEVVRMTLDGKVLSRFPLWVNTTLTGEPFQSLDMKATADRLYLLHRTPDALPLPGKSADDSVDKEIGIDLIDPSRIDVYTLKGDYLTCEDSPLASHMARYFSMDIDLDSGLVLVVGAYTGYAFLHAMRPQVELDIVAEYWDPGNWGMHGTEDFVLYEGKVYVPGSDGERPCILVYDLGWHTGE